jgi:multidrug efflux pump subunit AcrB
MNLTKLALGNPVAAFVAVLLALLFGAISLSRLPVQLTPEVEKPEITIRTTWRAAAPKEVEAEIIEPQEKGFTGSSGYDQDAVKRPEGTG